MKNECTCGLDFFRGFISAIFFAPKIYMTAGNP
jgi:hypothetical protein